jgi:hypothetical protein
MGRHVVLPSSQGYLKQAGRASKRRAGRYLIEGESVTYADIGKRLGVSESVAGSRVKREQVKAGPVTWEGLSQK